MVRKKDNKYKSEVKKCNNELFAIESHKNLKHATFIFQNSFVSVKIEPLIATSEMNGSLTRSVLNLCFSAPFSDFN